MNKRNVYLMYAIIFMQGFVLYGPVATLFRQARGISLSEIFIIESISWVVLVLLEVPWGWISDRIGYKKTLIIVNTLFFISKIVFNFANSFMMFLVERLLLSVVLAGLSGCDTALIYGSIKEKDSQKTFGRYHAMGTLGFLFAAVISSIVVPISMDLTASLTIIPYGIAALLTFLLVEVKTSNSEKVHLLSHFNDIFNKPGVLLLVISVAIMAEITQAITVFLNQVKYLEVGIHPGYFGLIIGIVQIGRLLSARAYKLTRHLGNEKTITFLMIVLIMCIMVLIYASSSILSVAAVFLIAMSMALIIPIQITMLNKTITSNRATILSIYSMIGGSIGAVLNIFIGRISEFNIQYGFIFCAVTGFVALLLWIKYVKKSS